jgi:glycine/D-amino acid oxidase-like deaminating enzyme
MSFTSASSGENYRNWWPHSTMKRFIDRSLDLVESLEKRYRRSFRQNERGYLLCTGDAQPQPLLDNLALTFGSELRLHRQAGTYPLLQSDGVDVLQGQSLVQALYPGPGHHAKTLVHIRRGGALDTQQLASTMLQAFREAGGNTLPGEVCDIDCTGNFKTTVVTADGTSTLHSDYVINAAGPFAKAVSAMLGVDLPLINVLQQKISFEDTRGVISRDLPFTIDLDDIALDWTAEERALLAADETMARFANTMAGAIHCRPDGNGQWVKLGWAYNSTPGEPGRQPVLDDEFPEIVLRGASRMHPGLQHYIGAFPGGRVHYGGFYTMTEENWPLIGRTEIPGHLIATGLSGFGSMAACATGELIASLVLNQPVDDYLRDLSLQRYQHADLLRQLSELESKGLL